MNSSFTTQHEPEDYLNITPSGELWDIKLASRGSLSLYSDKRLGPRTGGLQWEHLCHAFFFWLKNCKNKPIKLTRFKGYAPVSCLSVHISQVGLSLMSRHWSRLSFFILSSTSVLDFFGEGAQHRSSMWFLSDCLLNLDQAHRDT